MKHVALLRGINVGGRNKLAMRELAALSTGAGCQEVQTYDVSTLRNWRTVLKLYELARA
jgi:uncharacterized protein (DUF1697 family)